MVNILKDFMEKVNMYKQMNFNRETKTVIKNND